MSVRRLAAAALAALVVATAAPARAEAPFAFETTPGKLPKDVVPVEYALHLRPDIATRTFQGTQTITLDVRRPTQAIVMNALNLEVAAATLRGPDGEPVALAPPRADAAAQTIAFALPAPLAPGRYTLAMAWRGTINGAVEGLYLDRQVDAGGERLTLATDLEPTSARRVLPCWDEPVFRARFRLTVDLGAGTSAYSNMPVAQSEPLADGGRRVAFEATPPMPTYLLALVAGDLERVETTVDGTRVGVVTGRGKQGRTAYAAGDERGAAALLQRLLRAAVSAAQARPHRARRRLSRRHGELGRDRLQRGGPARRPGDRDRVDARARPRHDRARDGAPVVRQPGDDGVVGQPLAERGVRRVDGDQGQRAGASRKRTCGCARRGRPRRAMELDARATTHPIQQPVTRDSEVESAFDTITYDKGSSFVRMLEAWLGEAAFRDGIRAYLKRHQYANTTSADLWSALAAASGKPVAAIAEDWTTQPGFPLLDVERNATAAGAASSFASGRFASLTTRARPARASGAGTCRCSSAASVPARASTCSCAKRAPPSSATTIAPRRWSSTPTTSASSASAMPRRCSTRWRRAGPPCPTARA